MKALIILLGISFLGNIAFAYQFIAHEKEFSESQWWVKHHRRNVDEIREKVKHSYDEACGCAEIDAKRGQAVLLCLNSVLHSRGYPETVYLGHNDYLPQDLKELGDTKIKVMARDTFLRENWNKKDRETTFYSVSVDDNVYQNERNFIVWVNSGDISYLDPKDRWWNGTGKQCIFKVFDGVLQLGGSYGDMIKKGYAPGGTSWVE